MDITITFQDGKWTTDPDPAIVMLGTKIRWVVRAPRLETMRLRWTIDFKVASPFAPENRKFVIQTDNTGLGSRTRQFGNISGRLGDLGLTEEVLIDHRGTTPPLNADDTGDYKYDLDVANEDTGQSLGDEDPRLIVVRSIPVRLLVF